MLTIQFQNTKFLD